MRKLLSKVVAVVAVIMCVFVMSVSASAGYFTDYITGSWFDQYTVTTTSSITLDEAKYAMCTYLGITNAKLEASGLQFWASTDNPYAVEVWEDGNLAEVIYKDDNGYICGLASGFMVLSDDVSSGHGGGDGRVRGIIDNASDLLTVIGDVAAFVVSNDLCLLTLGFIFVTRAVVLVRKTIRVTPR